MNYATFLIFLFCTISSVIGQESTSVKVCSGKVVRYADFPSKFVTARKIDIWLPENYTKNKKYAVIYLHDGQMLFDSNTTWNKQEWGIDETLSKLMFEEKIKGCIVVGVWNAGKYRHTDYFPQKPTQTFTKSETDSLYLSKRLNNSQIFTGKINSDNYLKFLVNELKPFIDKTYSTHKNRENTIIGGASMGGLISIYALCEYPNVFGAAACLSTHWPGIFSVNENPFIPAMKNYLIKNLPKPKTHKIYFDFGTETLDVMYEPLQIEIDRIMESKGYSKKNWLTQKFIGDDHSEKSWNKRFSIPALFLLKK
jgi:hypothetical protein